MTEPHPPAAGEAAPGRPPGRHLNWLRGVYYTAAIVASAANIYILFLWRLEPWDFFGHVARTYAFNTLVLPLFFLATAAAGLFAIRRNPGIPRRFRRGAWIYFFIGIAAFGARLWATHIEPRMLRVRLVPIYTGEFSRSLRILHITDIQTARVGSYEERVFAKAQALKPDLVLFTGDLLQPLAPATYETELPKISRLFEQFSVPLGKFGVIGDVDPAPLIKSRVKGITWLEDEQHAFIEDGCPPISLFGLSLSDSRNPSDGLKQRLRQWIDDGHPNAFTILLGHAPDFVWSAYEVPIDLCLAGHTHGGQIRLPFYGPLVLLSDIPREWGRGFHRIGLTRLNVSAGIGGEHIANLPTIRVNCPPEMTLIELNPQ